jgi:uncharacterized protein YggU (UPF0235/DUF167 family)
VPVAAVKIARGERSRNKRVEISGATAQQVRALAALSTGPAPKENQIHAAD